MDSRRQFIGKIAKSSATIASLPTFGSVLVGSRHADHPQPHFLVFIQVYGAWDVCLAFDPKDRESRLSNGDIAFDQPYGIDEVRSFGNIQLAPHGVALGPYADRLAIINGVDMELDNGHTPIIVMTGDPQGISGQKPSIQALISDRHPYVRRCIIPHMYASYDGFFSGGALAGKTVTISRMDAHRVIFSAGGSDALKRADRSTRAAAAAFDAGSRQSISQYARALSQAVSLRGHIDQDSRLVAPPVSVEEFGDFAATLFKMGVLGSLTWSLGEAYNFDTHSNHYNNHPLKSAVEDIATFAARLGATPLDDHTSVLERTTIIVTGEFARTPRLNSSQGKDHNFRTNSIILLGANVNPGVYGKSGERRALSGSLDAHAGIPVSLETGRPDSNGSILMTRNVWAGAHHVLGVDLSRDFGADTNAVRFLG
jgi:hypothetical protein